MQHVRRFFILEDGCMVCWFMVFNATFNNKFQLYRGGQFYRRRKPEKTKSLLYRLSGIRIHNISGDRYCLPINQQTMQPSSKIKKRRTCCMEITLYYATLKRINSFCDFLLRDFITIQGSLTMHKSQFLAYLKTNYEHRLFKNNLSLESWCKCI
jgi:hypothetical protein